MKAASRTAPLAALCTLALACAPGPAPAPPPGPGEAQAPAAAPAAPKKGGTLVFSASQPPDTLMPYKGGSIGEYITFHGVYDGLVNWKFAPDLEVNDDYRSTYTVVPMLAEKWEQPDNRTYLFTLRRGVKWHDGQPFTVDDVLFSYGLLMDKANGYRGGTNLREVETIEKVGEDRVRIVIKAPSAQFLAGLGPSNSAMYILPRHLADSLNKDVVGTGPFKVKTIDLKSKATYVRADGWWGAEGPYMDGAEVVFGLDTSAQLAAIAARKIDFFTVGDRPQMDPILKAAPDLKTFSFMQSNGSNIYFRMDRKPYDDQRVRRAIDLAIDRQALVKGLYAGEAVINPPAGIGHKKNWGIPQDDLVKLPGYRQPKDQDVAEAKRLLAEAGFASGFKTTVIWPQGWRSIPQIFESVSGQLRAISIDMEVQSIERAAYNKRQREGDFEAQWTLAAGDLPDERLVAFYHSKGNTNPFIRDPQLDELIDRQSRTLDPAERGRLHAQMQRLVYDKSYTVSSVDPATWVLVQPWVHNITINRGAQPYPMEWAPIWLDAEKIPPR